MNERRTNWNQADPVKRSDQTDPWIEAKGLTRGVMLLPHGPLPVCDSWWLELPSTVRTRPHATPTSGSLGEVCVPMS